MDSKNDNSLTVYSDNRTGKFFIILKNGDIRDFDTLMDAFEGLYEEYPVKENVSEKT